MHFLLLMSPRLSAFMKSASAQLSDHAARTGSTETWYRDVFIFLVPTWYRSTGSFDNTTVKCFIRFVVLPILAAIILSQILQCALLSSSLVKRHTFDLFHIFYIYGGWDVYTRVSHISGRNQRKLGFFLDALPQPITST